MLLQMVLPTRGTVATAWNLGMRAGDGPGRGTLAPSKR